MGRTIVKSLRTIVATPRKWPGRKRPSRIEPSSVTSTQVWKPGGYISSGDGAKTRSTPSSRASARSRVRRGGSERGRSGCANCAGFTKRLITTVSFSARAARSSARWPSWSDPIVGTSPIDALRRGASASRISAMVRQTFTPEPRADRVPRCAQSRRRGRGRAPRAPGARRGSRPDAARPSPSRRARSGR